VGCKGLVYDLQTSWFSKKPNCQFFPDTHLFFAKFQKPKTHPHMRLSITKCVKSLIRKHNMTSHVRSWESYRFKEPSQYTGKSLTCHYIFYEHPIPVPAWFGLQEEKKPRVMPGPSWYVQKPTTDQHWS